MNKQLAFLFALTFLFLFSGFAFGQETEVKKEYWNNGKLKSETHYKNGKQEGLKTTWDDDSRKIFRGDLAAGMEYLFGMFAFIIALSPLFKFIDY